MTFVHGIGAFGSHEEHPHPRPPLRTGGPNQVNAKGVLDWVKKVLHYRDASASVKCWCQMLMSIRRTVSNASVGARLPEVIGQRYEFRAPPNPSQRVPPQIPPSTAPP